MTSRIQIDSPNFGKVTVDVSTSDYNVASRVANALLSEFSDSRVILEMDNGDPPEHFIRDISCLSIHKSAVVFSDLKLHAK